MREEERVGEREGNSERKLRLGLPFKPRRQSTNGHLMFLRQPSLSPFSPLSHTSSPSPSPGRWRAAAARPLLPEEEEGEGRWRSSWWTWDLQGGV